MLIESFQSVKDFSNSQLYKSFTSSRILRNPLTSWPSTATASGTNERLMLWRELDKLGPPPIFNTVFQFNSRRESICYFPFYNPFNTHFSFFDIFFFFSIPHLSIMKSTFARWSRKRSKLNSRTAVKRLWECKNKANKIINQMMFERRKFSFYLKAFF